MGASQSNLNLKKVKYLEGPVSLYYLKKNNIKMFLFGDEHYSLKFACNKTNNSIDIIKFFNEIFLSTNKKIDFLIESDYSYIENKFKDNTISDSSYLSKIIKHYINKKCLIKDKKVCSQLYPYVHFHSVDYRFSNLCKSAKDINNITIMLMILTMHTQLSSNNKIILNILNTIISDLNNINTYNKLENVINNIFKCNKLNKQIEKCDSETKTKILQYKDDIFNDNRKKYEYQYNDLIQKIIKINKESNNMLSYSILGMYCGALLNMIITINCIVMDIYCISRLNGSKDNNHMKNIIIYAGALHIENYVYFLTKYMNFTLEAGTKANEKRCLDISKLPKLLF